jgi:hypothetical protein
LVKSTPQFQSRGHSAGSSPSSDSAGSLLPLNAFEFKEALHGGEERSQIGFDGGLHHFMGGVEIAVGEVVAHPGDLAPRDVTLGGQEFLGGRDFTASPISRSRILTASNTSPSVRAPRDKWTRIASTAATMSAAAARPGRSQRHHVLSHSLRDLRFQVFGWHQVNCRVK